MNKQIKLIAAALIFSLTAFTVNAQNAFKKSDKIVEGSASYVKTEGSNASYSLTPTVGYFLTDRFAAGLTADFGKDANDTKTTGLGVFGRCYILNIGKNFKTFSQLNIGNTNTTEQGVTTSSFGVNLGIGANYFVSKNLALSVGLADLIEYSGTETNSTFSIGWNGITNPLNAANFGVLYRF